MEQSTLSPNSNPFATLTAEELALLKRTIARECTQDELEMFLRACRVRKADPFAKLLYPVKRWDTKLRQEVMALQSSIDYFRLTAERTGKYAGQLGPQWCGPDGKWVDVWLDSEWPEAARVGILRHDFKEPLWTVANWDSYVALDKAGNPAPFWRKMGPLMIAKCAEALGLRRAFPEDLAGLYVPEEMYQADPPEPASSNAPTAPSTAPAAPPRTVAELASGLPAQGAAITKQVADEVKAAQAARAASRQQKTTRPASPPKSPGEPPTPLPHKEEARAMPATYTWQASPGLELEVAYLVHCGPWTEWRDMPIPTSKLAERAPTWRLAAQGKKAGGRHAMLLGHVQNALKALEEGRGITNNHMRAACTLAMLLHGGERAEAETAQETQPAELFDRPLG